MDLDATAVDVTAVDVEVEALADRIKAAEEAAAAEASAAAAAAEAHAAAAGEPHTTQPHTQSDIMATVPTALQSAHCGQRGCLPQGRCSKALNQRLRPTHHFCAPVLLSPY
jgi:hypothetical protein